jgi:hypothetical protein
MEAGAMKAETVAEAMEAANVKSRDGGGGGGGGGGEPTTSRVTAGYQASSGEPPPRAPPGKKQEMINLLKRMPGIDGRAVKNIYKNAKYQNLARVLQQGGQIRTIWNMQEKY